MTTKMNVKEFWEIVGKLDNTTLERIIEDSVSINHFEDGKFQISVGNHVITTVNMRGAKFAVDIMLRSPEGYSKKLIDGLREAVGGKPQEKEEEPEVVDDDGDNEGIMQLAELFEEEEK